MINKTTKLNWVIYWALLRVCVFSDLTHASCIHEHDKHSQTHIQRTCRPLGPLPFTQMPLGKVRRSNNNTLIVVSEEVDSFVKRLSQSFQRSTTLKGENRSKRSNQQIWPQEAHNGSIFTICERNAQRSNKEDSQSSWGFFFLWKEKNVLKCVQFFKSVFLIPSAPFSLPRA